MPSHCRPPRKSKILQFSHRDFSSSSRTNSSQSPRSLPLVEMTSEAHISIQPMRVISSKNAGSTISGFICPLLQHRPLHLGVLNLQRQQSRPPRPQDDSLKTAISEPSTFLCTCPLSKFSPLNCVASTFSCRDDSRKSLKPLIRSSTLEAGHSCIEKPLRKHQIWKKYAHEDMPSLNKTVTTQTQNVCQQQSPRH